MAKKWQDSETNYLKRYAQSKTLEELAQRFEAEPAEVSAKLGELGLVSKDGVSQERDPTLDDFEKSLQALYDKSWKKAAGLLEKVCAESDQIELTERARQYLEICRERLGEDSVPDAEVDPFLLAVYRKNRGELQQAMELCESDSRSAKDERFVYLKASIHALAERADEAAQALLQAVEMNPKNRIYAYHDPDFLSLREHPAVGHLFVTG